VRRAMSSGARCFRANNLAYYLPARRIHTGVITVDLQTPDLVRIKEASWSRLFSDPFPALLRVSEGAKAEWFASSRRPSIDHAGRVVAFTPRQAIADEELDNDDDLCVWRRVASDPWARR